MDLVKQVYELRQKFMIIGLTGRTGSGCSTVADLLNGDFQTLAPPIPVENHEGTTNDERKYRIEYNFLKSIWEDRKFEFQIIKASDIIFYYALMEGYEKFVKIISLLLENETGLKKENTKRDFEAKAQSVFSDLKTAFEKNTEEVNKINAWLENKKYDNLNEEKSKEEARKHLEYLQHRLPEFRNIIMQKVVELLQVKTTKIFQEWGNNFAYTISFICNPSNVMGKYTQTNRQRCNRYMGNRFRWRLDPYSVSVERRSMVSISFK